MSSPSYRLDPNRIRDIAPRVLDHNGRVRVLPVAFWAETTAEERALFGHRHGVYGIPTVELVEHLAELIAERKAIEIGAGHGVLARALGIPATDSRQQNQAKYRAIYESMGQAPVNYGRNINAMDARAAVRRYAPEVVIASWVTHRWEAGRQHAEGNEAGVDEMDVLAHCQEYVFVGNEKVHAGKAIWDRPHTLTHPDFVVSRANNGTPDFLAIWPGDKS